MVIQELELHVKGAKLKITKIPTSEGNSKWKVPKQMAKSNDKTH